MPSAPRRRAFSLATAATLALGLAAAGPSVLAGPAQSADGTSGPAADCAVAYPVSELADGDAVTGLTVTRGTTPTSFTGEVIGVLEDGISPDVDMIMMELDSPEIRRAGGIWQGMSGSPVYAEDGRLIGAVAYGLAEGPSPIAGITPFAEMDTYLPGAPAPRTTAGRLDAADSRAVAERAGISTQRASRGFRELPMPLGVSGISARRLTQLQAKVPSYADKSGYVLGRSTGARAAGAETIVAGGNIGASVAYGDVTMAGVGTATSVCQGRVVGFGHPLARLGATTESLHPAEAVYVQPETIGSPFKVANIAPPVGTVDQDRTTGISGVFGTLPSTLGVTSEVTYGDVSRTGRTDISVRDFAAEATFYQLVANQDRVMDGPARGSELITWTITGTEAGRPFSLAYTDRWTGSDLLSGPSYGVARFVDTLGSLDGVVVDSVAVETDVVDSVARHTLVGVEQRRGGTWVRLTDRTPAAGRAGTKVLFRLVLGGTAGKAYRQLAPITLPKASRGRLVLLTVRPGDIDDYYWEDEGVSVATFGPAEENTPTVASLRSQLRSQLRHDQLRVELGTPDRLEIGYEGEDEYYRASRRVSFVRSQTTAPADHTVTGDVQVFQVESR